MRKTSAVDYENENLNETLLTDKKKCKYCYLLLPITHALSIGLGIVIGININYYDDGSL